MGLLAAVVGHNIASVFNDSTLSISVIYFIVLALLVVSNNILSGKKRTVINDKES